MDQVILTSFRGSAHERLFAAGATMFLIVAAGLTLTYDPKKGAKSETAWPGHLRLHGYLIRLNESDPPFAKRFVGHCRSCAIRARFVRDPCANGASSPGTERHMLAQKDQANGYLSGLVPTDEAWPINLRNVEVGGSSPLTSTLCFESSRLSG